MKNKAVLNVVGHVYVQAGGWAFRDGGRRSNILSQWSKSVAKLIISDHILDLDSNLVV